MESPQNEAPERRPQKAKPSRAELDAGSAVIPSDVSSQESSDLLKAIIEALLFTSDKPIATGKLAEIVKDVTSDSAPDLDGHGVRRLIEHLRKEYDEQGRAFQIEEIAGGFQMLTRPEYHECVRALMTKRQQARLSPAALETLAIIAYRQPVNRATIEDIRGVQAGQMIRTLIEKRLVKAVGREEVAGRPLLYGTTRGFLNHFGLKSIRDLPTIKELPRPS